MRAPIRGNEIYFDVDGAALVVDGSRMRERPTAFLVHGGPGSDHTSYKVRYSGLKERMQLVYFDHRGNGRSARGTFVSSPLDDNVDDMEALRQYLGLGPIVSIGGSYGGVVALAHAARYPDSVSHLIVFSTYAHAGFVEHAKRIIAGRGTAEQIAQCEALFSGRIDSPEKYRRYFEIMNPLYSRRAGNRVVAGRPHAVLDSDALNRAHGPGGFLRSFDLRPELPSIKAATLVMAGRHDWICPPELSEEIHRLIPGSELRIFEESSHTLGGDEPQMFLDAVAGFLVYNSSNIR